MKKFLITGFIYSLLAIQAVFCQADLLYEKGYAAYTKADWKNAAYYLGSYIANNPADFSDQVFKAQVTAAYQYARAEYLRSQTPPPPSNDGIGTSVAGLSTPPPALRKPKNQLLVYNVNKLSLDGTWTFKIFSASGTNTFASLNITVNGNIVSGTLEIVSGSYMQVVGSFDSGILVMSCITGKQTTQVYILKMADYRHFTGTFNNEGKWPDSGTIDMSR